MENAPSSIGYHVDLCIPSTTTDYARMEIVVSSTGDHVDLCIRPPTTHARRSPFHRPAIMLTRTPLHQPAIMLTFAYLRRPPTTHAWRSPFHRPAIMLTLHIFGDHRLHTYRERQIIDRRSYLFLVTSYQVQLIHIRH